MQKGKEGKPHIGIFGRRNYGKSSLLNVLTGQQIAIVSDQPGTTTDPVKKSMEIPGIGPVVLIDTAGIDDTGDLGIQRIHKTMQVLERIDMAILLISNNELGECELSLLHEMHASGTPFLIIHGKSDLVPADPDLCSYLQNKYHVPVVEFNNTHPDNLEELIRAIRNFMPETAYRQPSLLGDLVGQQDVVLLITPIDTEAPEGRLILPQVQAIRDILDNNCIAIVLKEDQTGSFLKNTGIMPKLVVCDTSVILKADASVPKNIPLTGFSILLAHHKGEFEKYLEGTPAISRLDDGDRVLIMESCTHHVSCDDIGRFKIPQWMSSFTGRKLDFDVVSGLDHLVKPITDYALVVQCGGCMITRRQLSRRLKPAIDANVPVTNYGMAIAYMQGVYERAIAPFLP
ncbi:MAG: [FeFe] hydrogenase H-cluster maturation GTPase HydF [Bacteroidales bacterium]|nr:[FeFe] hydrogenase H-cluster maturation GTPase HydF [Bacteroidales bacterium]